jgi:hypothetical protein
MLENGTHATIAEIAAAKKINESYVGRVLRPTLLATDIVEAILGGRQPVELQLEDLLRRFPVGWAAQRSALLLSPYGSVKSLRFDLLQLNHKSPRNHFYPRLNV